MLSPCQLATVLHAGLALRAERPSELEDLLSTCRRCEEGYYEDMGMQMCDEIRDRCGCGNPAIVPWIQRGQRCPMKKW